MSLRRWQQGQEKCLGMSYSKKAIVRKSARSDLSAFCKAIRKSDKQEVEDVTQLPLEVALERQLGRKEAVCYSIVSGSDIVGMFGCYHSNPSQCFSGDAIGTPWFLASDLLFDRHARQFIRESKTWVSSLASEYSALVNYTRTVESSHIGWLTRLGFMVGQREILGGVMARKILRPTPNLSR